MSFLTGLYFLGAAAIGFPILFHLIRRKPQQRVPFSSLMFLKPSPPRLTKRSRLDHLLLLLLRALAILLVAVAFMRPFYRQSADALRESAGGRRIAILLDSSASMRRADLWSQAVKIVETELDQLQPTDDVALFTFDDSVKTIVGFSDDRLGEPESGRSLVRSAITRLAPTWAHTELATALMTVAESLAAINDRSDMPTAAEILLISDMQEGARLQSLDGYQWPKDVHVTAKVTSSLQALSNASLRVLDASESENEPSANKKAYAADRVVRVRIENATDAATDQFDVYWANAEGESNADAVSIHVPAGQSRVLRLPQADKPLGADRLVLSGDDSPFDNQHFVNTTPQEVVHCIYVGDDDASDPEGLLFYLRLALPETRQTRVDVEAIDEAPLLLVGTDAPRLVVVGKSLSADQQQALEHYLQQGGTVLAVLKDRAMLDSLGKVLEGWTITAADTPQEDPAKSFALLGDIDFEHELLAPFAKSGYSDFTMIRFWQHRQVVPNEGSSAQVLANFDNGHPALFELNVGQGKFLVLTSGWHPHDSQLARSWKFSVLLSEILRRAGGREWLAPSLVVNQRVDLPWELSPESRARVLKPDGSEVLLRAGVSRFDASNLPGIYRATQQDSLHEFVVNLAASESRTAPLDADQLEMFGVPLGQPATPAEATQRLRQLRDIELESGQQVWRWLILAALVLLIFETWLAGRSARAPAELAATAAGLAAES